MGNAKDALLHLAQENIKELVAENARLKEERDHWRVEQVHAYGNWEDAHKRAIELEAENAKLRELASTMWPYIWEAYYSGEMPYTDYAIIRDRMQELGIGGSR